VTERTLTFGSLFAGVGGIDLGFERAGMQCKWQVEIDDDAGRVLDMHWPNVRRFKDVREVGKHNLEAVDVICGGFPCFPGGTLILTRDGFKAIEDVRKGDLVLTHKNRWQPVTSTMKREGETIVLKGQGHPGLETTDEHPFWSLEKKRDNRKKSATYGRFFPAEPEWTPAAQMEGRFWSSPAQFPPSDPPEFDVREFESVPCELTADFFWFVGAWLGDGLHATRVMDRTTDKLITTSKPLTRWLALHFGEGAAGKTIPAWALGMRWEYREALLEGYLWADGHIDDEFWLGPEPYQVYKGQLDHLTPQEWGKYHGCAA
jgi:hypothetical protein